MNISLSEIPQDENEAIERYIILLLGVVNRPIPSRLHLEKELFILSNFNKGLKPYFHFVSHFYGPYSQKLNQVLNSPVYFPNAIKIENNEIKLTQFGKMLYDNLLELYRNNPIVQKSLKVMKLIREMYDRLSKEELLLLIYLTYPEFVQKSNEYEKIRKNKGLLAKNLLEKGIITEKRYHEITKGGME